MRLKIPCRSLILITILGATLTSIAAPPQNKKIGNSQGRAVVGGEPMVAGKAEPEKPDWSFVSVNSDARLEGGSSLSYDVGEGTEETKSNTTYVYRYFPRVELKTGETLKVSFSLGLTDVVPAWVKVFACVFNEPNPSDENQTNLEPFSPGFESLGIAFGVSEAGLSGYFASASAVRQGKSSPGKSISQEKSPLFDFLPVSLNGSDPKEITLEVKAVTGGLQVNAALDGTAAHQKHGDDSTEERLSLEDGSVTFSELGESSFNGFAIGFTEYQDGNYNHQKFEISNFRVEVVGP